MKLYIPTLGRADNQITFDNLPKFLQEKTTLVVQPHEKHLYDGYPIVVLPKDWMGISRTRKFILEYAGKNLFGMLDDDFELRRRFAESPTKRPLTKEDWHEFYDTIIEWLNTDCTFAGVRRGNLPPVGKNTMDNTESLCLTFYNGNKLPNMDSLIWNHDLVSEDVNFHLQLLIKGHRNRVWCKYGYICKWAQEGGCQSGINPRTVELINSSHERLIELYPNFVKWSIKNGKQHIAGLSQGLSFDKGYKAIKVFYSNAYKSSRIKTLNFE